MVETTGMIRKVDELGRVVLPKETREFFEIAERDALEVLMDKENKRIILQKATGFCTKCQSTENLHEIKPNLFICGNCLAAMK